MPIFICNMKLKKKKYFVFKQFIKTLSFPFFFLNRFHKLKKKEKKLVFKLLFVNSPVSPLYLLFFKVYQLAFPFMTHVWLYSIFIELLIKYLLKMKQNTVGAYINFLSIPLLSSPLFSIFFF